MTKINRAPLVTGHAEDFHVRILKNYLSNFRDMIGRKPGIYILYKGEEPYYVGVASSVRRRLADHLKDHHRRKWDRFSFFQVKKEKYLKDIESLLIRAAKTKGKGNRNAPDFATHNNIKADMKRFMGLLSR